MFLFLRETIRNLPVKSDLEKESKRKKDDTECYDLK